MTEESLTAAVDALLAERASIPAGAGGLRWAVSVRIRSVRLKLARLRGTHTREQWELVLTRSPCCARCGATFSWRLHPTKDHIRAIASGGSDHITNLQATCGPCNSSKGSR